MFHYFSNSSKTHEIQIAHKYYLKKFYYSYYFGDSTAKKFYYFGVSDCTYKT